jgi:hypothetical protein
MFRFFPGCSGPGTTRARNMYSVFMIKPGGRFSGVTKTGQHEYGAASLLNGVKPSVATARLTFLGSLAKS